LRRQFSAYKVTPGLALRLGAAAAPPLPATLVDRGTNGILHREGRHRPELAYLYFEDEPQRQMSMKRLSRDEAFLLAVNMPSCRACRGRY
jgi:hypothetical protein